MSQLEADVDELRSYLPPLHIHKGGERFGELRAWGGLHRELEAELGSLRQAVEHSERERRGIVSELRRLRLAISRVGEVQPEVQVLVEQVTG